MAFVSHTTLVKWRNRAEPWLGGVNSVATAYESYGITSHKAINAAQACRFKQPCVLTGRHVRSWSGQRPSSPVVLPLLAPPLSAFLKRQGFLQAGRSDVIPQCPYLLLHGRPGSAWQTWQKTEAPLGMPGNVDLHLRLVVEGRLAL